jgi:hypothetical protein
MAQCGAVSPRDTNRHSYAIKLAQIADCVNLSAFAPSGLCATGPMTPSMGWLVGCQTNDGSNRVVQ